MERGAFMCLCPPRYSGKTCESGKLLLCLFLLGNCVFTPVLGFPTAFQRRRSVAIETEDACSTAQTSRGAPG